MSVSLYVSFSSIQIIDSHIPYGIHGFFNIKYTVLEPTGVQNVEEFQMNGKFKFI